jgi:predicted alpha/beta superfamily hydrolase
MNAKLLLGLIALVSLCERRACCDTVSTNYESISIGRKYKFRSTILNEERSYYVYLPESYEGNSTFLAPRYPVLYLLDGDAFFHHASGLVEYLHTASRIPAFIVIGIGDTDRLRDMTPTHNDKLSGREVSYFKSTGGGDAFRKFLQQELIPRIDSQYRTTSFKILAGHSVGGLIAIDAMLNGPHFDTTIAMDPSIWWDDKVIFQRAKQFFDGKDTLRGLLYISKANNPGAAGKPAAPETEEFVELMKSHENESFHSSFHYFSDEDHGSVVLLSLYDGLRFVFDGYYMPVSLRLKPSATGIKEHFAAFSKRVGADFIPSERSINDWAYRLLSDDGQPQSALELFRLNTELYPDSWNTNDSLAEAYAKTGDNKLASEYYERSVKLNPKNENAKKWLEEHKSK